MPGGSDRCGWPLASSNCDGCRITASGWRPSCRLATIPGATKSVDSTPPTSHHVRFVRATQTPAKPNPAKAASDSAIQPVPGHATGPSQVSQPAGGGEPRTRKAWRGSARHGARVCAFSNHAVAGPGWLAAAAARPRSYQACHVLLRSACACKPDNASCGRPCCQKA